MADQGKRRGRVARGVQLLFDDQQDLKLVEATGFENGVALLRYAIKK